MAFGRAIGRILGVNSGARGSRRSWAPAHGRLPVPTTGGFPAAQPERQVTGRSIESAKTRWRPIVDAHRPELAAMKQSPARASVAPLHELQR